MNKKQNPLKHEIKFLVSERILNKINRITEKLGGDQSEKLRGIFFTGLAPSIKSLDEGFLPVFSEYEELNQLKFILEDKNGR